MTYKRYKINYKKSFRILSKFIIFTEGRSPTFGVFNGNKLIY